MSVVNNRSATWMSNLTREIISQGPDGGIVVDLLSIDLQVAGFLSRNGSFEPFHSARISVGRTASSHKWASTT